MLLPAIPDPVPSRPQAQATAGALYFCGDVAHTPWATVKAYVSRIHSYEEHLSKVRLGLGEPGEVCSLECWLADMCSEA